MTLDVVMRLVSVYEYEEDGYQVVFLIIAVELLGDKRRYCRCWNKGVNACSVPRQYGDIV